MGDPNKHAMFNASSSSYWLDCSLWYQYKKLALEEGTLVSLDTEATKRGTFLHELSELALPQMVENGVDIESAIDAAVKTHKRETKTRRKLNDEDRAQLRIALLGAASLIPDDMDVEYELEVPLSHEPESTGTIDVFGVCEDYVLIADYKFGQTEVSPNASQLRIYAASALALLKEHGRSVQGGTRVHLAIIQPALFREPLVRRFDAMTLIKFQAYVDGVVEKQRRSNERRGAGSLSTCDWCAFERRCSHRTQLISSITSDLKTGGELPRHVVEEIVRSRSALKRAIDDCARRVVEDPDTFPNWNRVKVSNPRKWDPVLSKEEIASKLIDEGVPDPYVLVSPAQARDAAPKAAAAINRLSLAQGEHVRLHWREPGEKSGGKDSPKRPKVKVTRGKTSKRKKAKGRK